MQLRNRTISPTQTISLEIRRVPNRNSVAKKATTPKTVPIKEAIPPPGYTDRPIVSFSVVSYLLKPLIDSIGSEEGYGVDNSAAKRKSKFLKRITLLHEVYSIMDQVDWVAFHNGSTPHGSRSGKIIFITTAYKKAMKLVSDIVKRCFEGESVDSCDEATDVVECLTLIDSVRTKMGLIVRSLWDKEDHDIIKVYKQGEDMKTDASDTPPGKLTRVADLVYTIRYLTGSGFVYGIPTFSTESPHNKSYTPCEIYRYCFENDEEDMRDMISINTVYVYEKWFLIWNEGKGYNPSKDPDNELLRRMRVVDNTIEELKMVVESYKNESYAIVRELLDGIE